MNLLVHIHISERESPAVAAGNLLADYYRRLKRPAVSSEFQAGMKFHCAIDSFTDSHPLHRQACRLISPERRRLAGIIVDVAFDFFLCKNWNHFSGIKLKDFINAELKRIYDYVEENETAFSLITERLIGEKWLFAYRTIDGINKTFHRISFRSHAAAGLIGAEEEIINNKNELEKIFLEFYPELMSEFRDRKIII